MRPIDDIERDLRVSDRTGTGSGIPRTARRTHGSKRGLYLGLATIAVIVIAIILFA